MNQNQFRPWQILAACILFTTALTAHAGFFDDLGATLGGDAKKEPAKPDSATSASVNAPASSLTAIQKLQASFDALAKKEIPVFVNEYNDLRNDWYGLYEVCSSLYEIRDFSRIFSCVGIAEKWQAKVGEEPVGKNLFGRSGFPHKG